MRLVIIHPNLQFRFFLKMALEKIFIKPEILEFESKEEAKEILFGNPPDFNLGILSCGDGETVLIFIPGSEKSKTLSRFNRNEFENAVEEVVA